MHTSTYRMCVCIYIYMYMPDIESGFFTATGSIAEVCVMCYFGLREDIFPRNC